MTVPNTTYRILTEKLGDSNPSTFVGNEGEVFYDPNNPELFLSDGSTAGGISIGGGGGEGQWTTTGSGIYYNGGNVAIGTNVVGTGSTVLLVDGNARVTGILSIGQGTITIDGNQNTIKASRFVGDGSDLINVVSDSYGYRGFSVFVNRFWGDDPTINQLAIVKDFDNSESNSIPFAYNRGFNTDQDEFTLGGLSNADIICLLNVYGTFQDGSSSSEYPNESLNDSPISLAALQAFAKRFIDKVLYDGGEGLIGTVANAMTAFYANYEELKSTLPPLYQNFEFTWPDSTNYIDDGGDDQYDDGNYINCKDSNQNVNLEIQYGNGAIDDVLTDYFGGGSNHGVVYQDSIWGMIIFNASVDSVWYSGGIGADGSGKKQQETLIGASENLVRKPFIRKDVSNSYVISLEDIGRLLYVYNNTELTLSSDLPIPVGAEIKIYSNNDAYINLNGSTLYVNGKQFSNGDTYKFTSRSIATLTQILENYWVLEVFTADPYTSIAKTSDETISNGIDTVLSMGTVDDPNSWFTGSAIQPSVSGVYSVTGMVNWKPGSDPTQQTNIQLRINGNTFAISQVGVQTNIPYTQTVHGLVTLNGTSDYIEFTAYTSNPTSQDITGDVNGSFTKLELYKIS